MRGALLKISSLTSRCDSGESKAGCFRCDRQRGFGRRVEDVWSFFVAEKISLSHRWRVVYGRQSSRGSGRAHVREKKTKSESVDVRFILRLDWYKDTRGRGKGPLWSRGGRV